MVFYTISSFLQKINLFFKKYHIIFTPFIGSCRNRQREPPPPCSAEHIQKLKDSASLPQNSQRSGTLSLYRTKKGRHQAFPFSAPNAFIFCPKPCACALLAAKSLHSAFANPCSMSFPVNRTAGRSAASNEASSDRATTPTIETAENQATTMSI